MKYSMWVQWVESVAYILLLKLVSPSRSFYLFISSNIQICFVREVVITALCKKLSSVFATKGLAFLKADVR